MSQSQLTPLEVQNKIEQISQYLPVIRPLNEFLHLPLYPDLLKIPFEQALLEVSTYYAHFPLMSIQEYHLAHKRGLISEKVLLDVAQGYFTNLSQDSIKEKLFRDSKKFHLPEKTYRPLHKCISEKIHYSFSELTESLLIRFLSNYLDQGFAYWPFPEGHGGLFSSFKKILLDSYVHFFPFEKKLVLHLQEHTSAEAVSFLLSRLFVSREDQQQFIEESLLSLRGWSGLIKTIERYPYLLMYQKEINLMDFLALKFMIDVAWFEKFKVPALTSEQTHKSWQSFKKHNVHSEEELNIFFSWQNALEKTFHARLLSSLCSFVSQHKSKDRLATDLALPISKKLNLFFCIDDRECRLRQLLEMQGTQFTTFGTPGHFGLNIYYQATFSSVPLKHCPAPLQAPHLVRAFSQKDADHYSGEKANAISLVSKTASQIADSFFRAFTAGSVILRQIVSEFTHPDVNPVIEHPLKSFPELLSDENLQTYGKRIGYSVDQAAATLAQFFKILGLTQLKGLNFFIGHFSQTTNNAYFNAYGCGACSGRDGGVNAQIMVTLANHKSVKESLFKDFKIDLREAYFVAGLHDTCADQVTFFSPDKIPVHLQEDYRTTKMAFKHALEVNAAERVTLFAHVPGLRENKAALFYTKMRGESVFEPRPELGHTGNAICFVGKRETTRGFDFGRRAFLQSYDSKLDSRGENLIGILSAAIPVCGGINLDYFFSRVNNPFYGSGSKLSHNIVSLLALSNGTEDDLLTGIAQQMTELHDPQRIIFIVEAEEFKVNQILQDPQLGPWIKNFWVYFAFLDPDQSILKIYTEKGFVKIDSSLGQSL
jgi:uncharacterized protein YbcC (UPF0753/DUF2309 family)